MCPSRSRFLEAYLDSLTPTGTVDIDTYTKHEASAASAAEPVAGPVADTYTKPEASAASAAEPVADTDTHEDSAASAAEPELELLPRPHSPRGRRVAGETVSLEL